jgi:hypothetical protein
MIDVTNVRSHRCAAGAKGGGIARHWARSRGGFGSKLHLAVIGAADQLDDGPRRKRHGHSDTFGFWAYGLSAKWRDRVFSNGPFWLT